MEVSSAEDWPVKTETRADRAKDSQTAFPTKPDAPPMRALSPAPRIIPTPDMVTRIDSRYGVG